MRLLFLAERNHSVLLTSDGVLKGCAESLGITCWNGDAGALARLFPMPLDPPAVQQESPLTKLSSKKISPRRQVPGRDEPMESRRRQTRGLNESRSSETMQ